MKLIACPACERKIAFSAKACPKCGHEVTSTERAHFRRLAKEGEVLRLVGFLLLVGGSIGGCASNTAILGVAGLGALLLLAGKLR
jgi:hypothetical protein